MHHDTSLSALTRLFELATRQMHAMNHESGLYPAQWSTLRYLAVMPDELRTSSALARFQQLASGAVTRTVRTLISKGYVKKGPSKTHHRAEMLDLTDSGKALLERDPIKPIDSAIAKLESGERESLKKALVSLLAAIHGKDVCGQADQIFSLSEAHI